MRRFFAVWMGVAVGLSLLTGCVQTPKEAYLDRIWCGIIYRSSDSARLSPVCLRLSNDTLNIYSNALFGRSLETMSCRRTSDSTYVAFLPNAGVEFPMEFRYTAPDSLTREALCIDGTDYWMELWPTTDSVFTAELRLVGGPGQREREGVRGCSPKGTHETHPSPAAPPIPIFCYI